MIIKALLLIRVLLQKLLLSELTVPCTVSGTCLPNCFTIPNPSTDVQKEFDLFYDKLLDLFNNYYPLRTITVSSRDPDYVTPAIKAKLRRKNRLMHVGRLDEADALAKQIAKDISKSTKSRLSHISLRRGTKGVWAAVRELTGRKRQVAVVDGITAQSLNDHYAAISTDSQYSIPVRKPLTTPITDNHVTDWEIFKLLDKLRPTATGLDLIPAWFLHLAAPVLCKPLSRLFNLSLSTGIVPSQWKQAYIQPVPKVPAPTTHADFRPISITPVLTRIFEKIIVRRYIYPALLAPPPTLTFHDQFAFRPTGSTTAALVSILHAITSLLTANSYVIVIALDFSKAFDTVRHSAVLQKLAQLDIPDHIFNWISDYLQDHSHCIIVQQLFIGFANCLCQYNPGVWC